MTLPASFAQHENGLTLAADGFSPVKRWDGETATVEAAGVAAPTLAVVLAGTDDGPLFGTYFAYVRFVDRLGNVSNVSPVSEALVLSSVSGTITTMTNVTVGDETYTRLHSTGISTLLVNGNVVVISGTNGMTGIDGTWYYYADPNGATDDFFLQATQGQILATGTYTSGGTWTGPSGTITNAVHVTVAGVTYTRLSTSDNIWSTMRDGTTITLASIGGVTGINGTWTYHKDGAGATNDFFVTNLLEPYDAGLGPFVSNGTWSGATVALTNAVEVVEGALDGTGTRYTRFTAAGIWAAIAEGSPIQISGVSGLTGVNGDWTFARATAPYGATDEFTVSSGGVKVLGVPSYTGGGTWSGSATHVSAIAAGYHAVFTPNPYSSFTELLIANSWADFTDGDRITIAGLSGLAADFNGTWYFFKSATLDTGWIADNSTGFPRLWSDQDDFFHVAELAGNTTSRSPASSGAIASIEQVVDSFGPYSRIKATGIWATRQDGDDVTLAGITGEFSDLNGVWTWFKDRTHDGDADYFNLESGGITGNAVVTYTSGGTYATAFGVITNAANAVVSAVSYTRITSAGIQTALTDNDTIIIDAPVGFGALAGTWNYHADANGTSDDFYVTAPLTPVLGSGTYTSGGTWEAPSGTVDAVAHVTVNDVSYTRLSATTDGIWALLVDGTRITLAGMVAGGVTGLDGDVIYYQDTVGGEDTFYVQSASSGVLGVGDYSGGAQWTKGSGQINFSNVEIPTDAQVTRRQILRNADGNTTTFYVDIDTDNLTGTTFSSTRTDTELTAQEAVPLFDSNQVDLAVSRYSVPPNDLPLLINARSRMLFSGSAVYTQGAVDVVNGSATVTGIGTNWTPSLAGRLLCISEEATAEISAVNVDAQTLTLTSAWAGTTAPYADYSIRSGESRRRLVAWSEAGLPEAVPPTNAFQLTREGTSGDITAVFLLGPLIYLAEMTRTHVFNFANDPAPSPAGGDGAVFLHSYRGAVNQRCVVVVEDVAFVLDQQGVHAMSSQGDQPLSDAIQDVFDGQGDYQYRIRWEWARYFHACHDFSEELIYWFVNLDCRKYPHFALVFDYRGKRWWINEYPFPITCSIHAQIGGAPATLVGSKAERMFVLGHGTRDGLAQEVPAMRGDVTSAALLTLTDSGALFTDDVVGLSVTITAGTGVGQTRIVVSLTDTSLTLQDPWLTIPASDSEYVVAGISYEWKSGVFRFPPAPEQDVRAIELVGQQADSGTGDLQVFLNRSETPFSWGTTTNDKGITTLRNDSRALLNLSRAFGLWKLRLDGVRSESLDGDRFFETRLAGVQAQDPLSFFELTIDGVAQ